MFVVTKRFGRSEARAGNFNKQADAEQFIQEKLREDVRFKVNATYGLYEGADLLQEFTQSDVIPPASGESSQGVSDSTAGSGHRSSFTPTPFNTTPRPTGMPVSGFKDEDDDKK